jgi:hypothetical protein
LVNVRLPAGVAAFFFDKPVNESVAVLEPAAGLMAAVPVAGAVEGWPATRDFSLRDTPTRLCPATVSTIRPITVQIKA